MNFNDIKKEDYNKNTFGQCIRAKREEIGYSLRAVALLIGVSAAYLSDIENGSRFAPTSKKDDKLGKLASVLKIPKNEIASFYDMAYATRGKDDMLASYIGTIPYLRTILSLSKELNVGNDFWQGILNYLLELKYGDKQKEDYSRK